MTKSTPAYGQRVRPMVELVLGQRKSIFEALGELTQRGDVVHFALGLRPAILLQHPDLIEAVLVTHNKSFVKPRGVRELKTMLGNGLLISEGDFWRRQRRLASPAFHKDRIAAYAAVMVAYTEHHLATWQAGQTRDVNHEMMALTLAVVAKTLFDTDAGAQTDMIGQAVDDGMRQFAMRRNSSFLLPDWVPTRTQRRFRVSMGKLNAYIQSLIDARRASGVDHGDLFSMLLAARDEDGSAMSDTQLMAEAKTIFLAGHETTANALTWTFVLLAQNPAVEERLRAELKAVLGTRSPSLADLPQLPYLEHTVSESLRLYPPAFTVGREAREDVALTPELTIARGETILMPQFSVHRDPRWFEQPLRFLPERWEHDLAKRLPTYAYFPFGGGPRLCIGNRFALMEAALLLGTILQRFRLQLLPDTDLTPDPAITLRPKHAIKMTLRA